uniref:3-beta hydroxysteroid dehydrogenase/isomerase domain-containing protein n=1 Tax=Panagrolaimus davidi TaxID=227884 RepID=A0A914QVD0_9BILA
MVKVVITGGSGFIAQHLIKRLQENFLTNDIEEITTIDRKPFPKKYLRYPENIPIFHKQCELTNLESVKSVLKNKNVVFHLGRKRFEMLFDPEKDGEISEAYIRDNIEATETLIEAMIAENVQYLVYLGDAYANLELEENYGLSEDNYSGIPKTFLTGEYGETKIRGEIFARKSVGRKLKNGEQSLQGVFPRATFVYGEGDTKTMETFLNVCQRHQGCIPFFEGSSRGMFQYVSLDRLFKMLWVSFKN